MASSVEQYVQNLVHVPAEFLVQGNDRPLSQDGLFEELPLIDMSQPEQEIRHKISAALQEWGFFQVVNHGIPVNVVENARRVARQFFELPVEEKMKWARDEGKNDQIAGYGRTDGFRGQHTDWMDSLYAFLAPPSLKAPHLWPSTPEDYSEKIDMFGEKSEGLMKRLLKIISEDMGMGEEDLGKEFAEYNLFMRANYYPPCPQPDMVLGTHAHKDHGAITILVQDNICDGLQVQKKDGRWIAVAPLPNALVINLGESLVRIAKGKYRSALHRGVVTNKSTAMTLVLHLDPPLDL
uniref:TSA: Wollemia nobilis Ref_Wollemi_Transcript_492_1203 transcribed RNA sequence n=1 Tax=Wollemia nobilis TaxID=56998 RepID=A0A0C9QXY6_9CONI